MATETPAVAPSLPEIALTKGHQNAECAGKGLAASMARLSVMMKVANCYVAAKDPTFTEPPPLGVLCHPSYQMRQSTSTAVRAQDPHQQ